MGLGTGGLEIHDRMAAKFTGFGGRDYVEALHDVWGRRVAFQERLTYYWGIYSPEADP
jgi:hypothetical protein